MIEKNYDVFISIKNLDHKGKQTLESQIASKLHQFLSSKKLNVFFSKDKIRKLGECQFKQIIDDVLEPSKAMVVIDCRRENMDAKWIVNERGISYTKMRQCKKNKGGLKHDT
jgi:hypothetical protein